MNNDQMKLKCNQYCDVLKFKFIAKSSLILIIFQLKNCFWKYSLTQCVWSSLTHLKHLKQNTNIPLEDLHGKDRTNIPHIKMM